MMLRRVAAAARCGIALRHALAPRPRAVVVATFTASITASIFNAPAFCANGGKEKVADEIDAVLEELLAPPSGDDDDDDDEESEPEIEAFSPLAEYSQKAASSSRRRPPPHQREDACELTWKKEQSRGYFIY